MHTISKEEKMSYYQDESTKKENFKRLAESRTEKAIDEIRKIGNLANTNNYSYTKEQVEKIFNALNEAIEDTKKKYRINEKERFTL